MSGLPVWAVPAQASRAGRDEPIVTVDAGSHVRPVGSECWRVPPSIRPTSGGPRVHVGRRDAKPWEHPGPVTADGLTA